MAVPLIQRLQVLVTKDSGYSPKPVDFPLTFFTEETREWNFHTYLAKQPSNFFKQLVPSHITLTMELVVLRAQLARELKNFDKSQLNSVALERIEQNLQAALALSSILETLYRDYLNVPREEARLQNEQREYRDWLATHWQYHFSDLKLNRKIKINTGFAASQTIRNYARELNPLRLLFVRIRRLLLLVGVLLTSASAYGQGLAAVEQVTAPFFAYIAWLFFMPRLLANLALTCKHVLPNPWMSEKEKSLGWQTRLRGQLERRWPELTNDIAWFINGILICFVLTGPLLPTLIYLAVAIQFYDYLMANLRATIEISRFRTLEKQYQEMAKKAKTPAEKQAINAYLHELKQRLELERKALHLSLVNFGALLVAICLSVPPLAAITPIIPIVGAGMAILITLVNYFGMQKLDQQRRMQFNAVRLPAVKKATATTQNKIKLFDNKAPEPSTPESFAPSAIRISTPQTRSHKVFQPRNNVKSKSSDQLSTLNYDPTQ